MTHVAYPAGPTIDLTYAVDPGLTPSYWPLLMSVTNSLGRRLDFSYSESTGNNILAVSDNSDALHPRSVSFDGVYCRSLPFPHYGAAGYASPCENIFTGSHDAEGNVTAYDYIRQWPGGQTNMALPATGEFSQVLGDNLPWETPAYLAAIHLPGSSVSADYAFSYDVLGRIQTATDAESNTWQYWIGNGRRGEIVDPLGGNAVSIFDKNEREITDIDALGHITTLEYDGLGRNAAKTNPEGIREEYVYDDRNNLIQTTRHPKSGSPLANIVTSATYHATCNVPLTETDARGNVTTHVVDSATCLEISVTGPAVIGGSPTTSWTYNSLGQVLTETDPTGLRARYSYNASNYLASVIMSDGALNLTTTFGYDAAGNVTSLIDPRSNAHTAIYDKNRRIKEWDAPLGAITQWAYDPTGLLLTVKRATGSGVQPWATTTFTYWPTGKTRSIVDPDGAMKVTEHDALGRTSKVTDPMGRVVTTSYDLLGEVLQERRGVGTASEIVYATHTWTADGKEATVADANNNLTTYAYDGFDRLSKQAYPSSTTTGQSSATDYETFDYDANSNVTSHRTRGAVSITSTYDALNRLITKLVPAWGAQTSAVTTTMAYDLAGRETQASDTLGNILASTYDTAGRLATVVATVPGVAGTKTVSYQYDASGNRTRLTWPDGYYVVYGFDALNRLTTASENGTTTLATYTYDPLSRRTGLTYGNTAAVTYGYSLGGDLSSLVHNLTGTTNDATTTLTFNLAHQLSGESLSNAAWRMASPPTATTAYTVNGLNQYPTVGGTAHTWDSQGNLTSNGVWTYGFDAENHLLTASKTGVAAVYAYDPRGRRTKKSGTGVTTTLFLDSGNDEIAEYDTSNALTRRFVPGPAIDQPIAMVTAANVRTYFHTNHQGSVVTMSDASGNLAEGPYTYDAYGNASSNAGEPYKFTGRRLDVETGLYYYRARYYSSSLGRFLQQDPIGYKIDLNVYTYGGNDPGDNTDPEGLWTCASKKSQTQCDLASKSIKEAKEALKHMSRRDAAKVKAILSVLGDEGVKNGVEIAGGAVANDRIAQTHTENGVTTITINEHIKSISQLEQSSGASAAGVIVHEGSHAADQRTILAGRDPSTPQEHYDTERRAFTAEAQIERALNYPDAGPVTLQLWDPVWSLLPIRDALIQQGVTNRAWETSATMQNYTHIQRW